MLKLHTRAFCLGKALMFSLIILMFSSVASVAQTASALTATDSLRIWQQNMRTALDTMLLDAIFDRSQVGLLIYDLTDDSVLYDHGSRQLLRPASVEKVITTVTGLTQLGCDYNFTTRLFMKGEVSDSVLHGDIYIRGGFDPLFSWEDMDAFVKSFRQHGIKQIDGNIYADVSFKDTLKWGDGWCWDDEERTLTPLPYGGRDAFIPQFFMAMDEDSIQHPIEYAETIMPQDSLTLLCERIHTMDQVIVPMLKHSNNFYAEALYYQLGASTQRPYASSRQSATKVEEFIRSIGMNPNDYYVADGSGLSRRNFTTAELVVRVLRHVWHSPEIYKHLKPALPIAGVDGTLESRMRGTTAEGVVTAKTGTLFGVSTLAGYAPSFGGHTIAFAILNHGIRNGRDAHTFQNKVCEVLTQAFMLPVTE